MILASGSVFTYHTRSKPDVCVSYLGLSLNTNLCVWVRCSVGFIMRLHSTGVLDENTISQTSYVETDTRNLGGFGFWKEFHSVSLTLLLLVKFSPSFEQVKYRTVTRISTRYQIFHGSAHFFANSWSCFVLPCIVGRSRFQQRSNVRLQRVGYIYSASNVFLARHTVQYTAI